MEEREAFGPLSNNVEISDMTPWQKTLVTEKQFLDTISQECDAGAGGEICFPFHEDLNTKVYLWNGDITKLAVQAAVLPLYEATRVSSSLHYELVKCAGPQLIQDCRKLLIQSEDLPIADVNLVYGYDMAARHAIMSVEPKFNGKFQTAADTALHNCYRATLQFCAEKGFKTIAIAPLHSTRRGFSVTNGAGIALRTIRKCLDILSPKFDAVVIVTNQSIVDEYAQVFPLYFPRSMIEAEGQRLLLPKNLNLGKWGEILQKERSIRIADVSEIKFEAESEIVSETVDPRNGDETTSIDQTKAPHAFPKMSLNHDRNRRLLMHYSMSYQTLQAQERIYHRLLRNARSDDFSNFTALRAIKVCGYDVTGNRVIIIAGRQLVFSQMDPEKFLLYLIATFDPVVNEPYTVIYFHTHTSAYNYPSSDYLRKLYSIFDQRYRSNLARICMVHMTSFLVKMRIWMFMTLSAGEVRDRVSYVRSVPELYKIVKPNQIEIPPYILDYDLKKNADDYKPPEQWSNPTRKAEVNRVMDGTL